MANDFLKPEVIASTAIGLLGRELILGQLVWTSHGLDFAGAKGDTVNLRVPAHLTAREYDWRNDRSATIQTDDIAEDSYPVSLNHDLYSAVAVTDEEMTLDIESFGTRVLAPQVRAVAEEIDGRIASMIQDDTNWTTDVNAFYGVSGTWDAVLQARKVLNQNNVPREGRFLLVGADFESELLALDKFSDVDRSGSSSALREAVLGRLAGFTVVGSNAIAPTDAFAFVSSAFLVATRAPVVPAGAPFAAAASHAGYSMRWIRDYDPSRLQDRSIVSTFAGFNVVKDQPTLGDTEGTKVLKRAVKLSMDEAPSDPS